MTKPNEALLHSHHPYTTSEEVLQDLNGSTFFSKLISRHVITELNLLRPLVT